MSEIQIFWDPTGLELDTLGQNKLLRITDGDTPYVSVSIRMLSIDTPEVHYPGRQNPVRHDERLAELAQWLTAGQAPVPDDLAAFLTPKLASGQAGTLQKAQGEAATEAFQSLLDQRLTRPTGSKRSLFLRAADQPFDQYGRLLAYVAPSFSSKERGQMTRWDRATFNLLMVESGWAAPFLIFPSLPRHTDLEWFHSVAKRAVVEGRGAWADPLTLTGYEFRMCYRLWEVTKKLVQGTRLRSSEKYSWVGRYCADLTSREIYHPADYHRVEPYNRLFIWPADVNAAVGRLNLVPAALN